MARDFDVIVIGAGIGGLSASALLARRGFKVLLLEQGAKAGGCCQSFQRNGYLFDVGSTLFAGLEEEGVLQRILKELKARIVYQQVDGNFGILIGDKKIRFFSQRARFFEEIRRSFPKDYREILEPYPKFEELADLVWDILKKEPIFPPHGGYRSLITRHFKKLQPLFISQNLVAGNLLKIKNPEIKRLVDGYLFFNTQRETSQSALLNASLVLTQHFKGLFSLRGGLQTFVLALVEAIKSNGGKISYQTRVDKILLKKGEAFGVRLANGEVISSWSIISDATIWNTFEKLLDEEEVNKRIRKKLRQIPQPWGVFCLYLGLSEKAIPPKLMDFNQIHLSKNSSHWEGNTLFISLSPLDDFTRAPQGKRAVTVTQLTFLDSWARDSTYHQMKEDYIKRTIRLLEGIFFDFKRNIDFLDAATPCTFENHTLRPKGAIWGIPQVPQFSGLRGFPIKTEIKNLLMVGDSVFVGKGVATSALSGYYAANLLTDYFI